MQWHANELPWWAWILIAALLLTQGIWLFRDAQKRGANPWFWGIYGLTNVPSVFLIYWLLVIRRQNKQLKTSKEENKSE